MVSGQFAASAQGAWGLELPSLISFTSLFVFNKLEQSNKGGRGVEAASMGRKNPKMDVNASEFVPNKTSGAAQAKSQAKNKEKKSSPKKVEKAKGQKGAPRGSSKALTRADGGKRGGGWQRSEEQWGKGSHDIARVRSDEGQSAASLLNFTYYDGPADPLAAPAARRPTKNSWQQELHNKQQFMQANFRFEIKPDCVEKFHESRHIGATAMLEEADRGAHWDDVACVHTVSPAEDPARCPICLDEPKAAQMTKCGHLYCLPCIRHYLDLGESNWRRCPMCFNSVHSKELRSARIASASQAAVGSTLRFVQLQRVKGSVTPVLIHNSIPAPNSLLPSDHPAAAFSKHTVATPAVLESLRQQQRGELEEVLGVCDDPATELYVEKAILEIDGNGPAALKGAEPLVKAPSAPGPATTSWPNPAGPSWVTSQLTSHLGASAEEDAVADEDIHQPSEATTTTAAAAEAPPPPSPSPGTNVQYFHQSADGRALFLHPWSNKMLLHNRGLTGSFPEDLTVEVVAIENHTVSEELRKRHTCLRHLPVSSSFTFCEVNLEGIVEPATMEHFQEELT